MSPSIFMSGIMALHVMAAQVDDDRITVSSKSHRIDLEHNTVTYTEEVEAKYGLTVIRADNLTLNYETKEGKASGHVRVIDPEGSLDATDLDFNWDKNTGHAVNVLFKIEGIRATASEVFIREGKWDIRDFYFTRSLARKPDLAVRTSKIEIIPGKKALLTNPSVLLWNRTVIKIPVVTPLSLDRRIEGLKVPAISFRRGNGFGVAWSSGFLLSEQLALSAQYAAFPQTLPFSNIALTWSSVSPSKVHNFVQPRSDLGERAAEGYLDNVYIKSVKNERSYLSGDRSSVTLQSSWNQVSSGRVNDSKQVSKRVEAVVERGGEFGGFGVLSQFRLQSIRVANTSKFTDRIVGLASAISPDLSLGKQLSAHARADVFAAAGKGHFSWLRSEIDFIWNASHGISLGAAYVRGKEWGSGGLPIDPLYSRHGANLRADWQLGNYRLGGMLKYDFNQRKWYDTEWSFSFIAGSFEPYIQARLTPRELRFGFQIRVESLFQRLSERTVARKKK